MSDERDMKHKPKAEGEEPEVEAHKKAHPATDEGEEPDVEAHAKLKPRHDRA